MTSASGVVLLACVGLVGCATLDGGPPDTTYQATLGEVAVVATEQLPTLGFGGFAHGKGEGALTGAGGTFAACLSGGGGGCSGAACGAALLLILGICGVAGLVGGIAGAAEAPDASLAAASEARLAQAMEIRTVQAALRDQVAAAALQRGARLRNVPPALAQEAAATRDYRSFAAFGVDSVVETSLIEAGTRGTGINAPVGVHLRARVRVLATGDNGERLVADYLYQGRHRTLAEWAADDGRPLKTELEAGYRALGEHIYDQVFELLPLPDRRAHSAGGALSTAFGLAPISPPTRGQLSGESVLGDILEWTAVDSLRPTLQWQAFPRASDVAVAPAEMARVREVSYDLVIAQEMHRAPERIVYRRQGLPAPEHRLETALEPGTRYFWTIRSRFQLDGRSRLTEWGSTHTLGGDSVVAPSAFAYRFRTPKTAF
jgi:hypothetical protein